jgi:hypothetical protein
MSNIDAVFGQEKLEETNNRKIVEYVSRSTLKLVGL